MVTKEDIGSLVAYRPEGEEADTAFWGRMTNISLDGFARLVDPETGGFEGDVLARLCYRLPEEEQ